jgi:hypothetical protein
VKCETHELVEPAEEVLGEDVDVVVVVVEEDRGRIVKLRDGEDEDELADDCADVEDEDNEDEALLDVVVDWDCEEEEGLVVVARLVWSRSCLLCSGAA